MKPIIGFSDYGHLGEHTAEAIRLKGFKVSQNIGECDVVFISPDRPGDVSPEEAVDRILPQLRQDAILVILCQVIPGFTRKVKWPISQLYYQVETLRMSDAEDRALHPERLIVGQEPIPIEGRFLQLLESFNCRIVTMSYESAELTKIAINLYLASQVSTTNTLAEIAEKIGANWNEIIPALQTDKRIGREAYLKPGYGLSPHLIRDLQTITSMDGNTDVMKAFYEHSEYRRCQKQ